MFSSDEYCIKKRTAQQIASSEKNQNPSTKTAALKRLILKERTTTCRCRRSVTHPFLVSTCVAMCPDTTEWATDRVVGNMYFVFAPGLGIWERRTLEKSIVWECLCSLRSSGVIKSHLF